MTRQWTLNLALLLAVLVLVGIAFFQPGLVKKSAPRSLTDINPLQVKNITIERPTHDTIELGKTGSQWMLINPIHARASDFIVSNVLAIAKTPSLNQLPYDPNRDSAKYGFGKPKAILSLDKERIVFGDTNPLNQQRYVLYHDQVHMISPNAIWAVTHKAAEFLDKRLLEFKEAPVAIYFSDGKKLELKNGIWVLQPKIKSLATDALTQLVNEWRYAGATEVRPYAGAAVHGIIRVVYKNKRTIELGVIAKSPELILLRKDENLQYYFPASAGARLLLTGKK
ncbi:MAG: DUF4340 domain-containing protein [Acidiferrobacterales bacterium]|nr:DUF4340 domain-containing protein [Acidiferrobacterales bacterium]